MNEASKNQTEKLTAERRRAFANRELQRAPRCDCHSLTRLEKRSQ